MANLEKGARVSFCRASDKRTRIAGTVEQVQGDEVLVRTDETEVLIWAPAEHVTAELVEAVAPAEVAPAESAPTEPDTSSSSGKKRR